MPEIECAQAGTVEQDLIERSEQLVRQTKVLVDAPRLDARSVLQEAGHLRVAAVQLASDVKANQHAFCNDSAYNLRLCRIYGTLSDICRTEANASEHCGGTDAAIDSLLNTSARAAQAASQHFCCSDPE